MKFFTQIDCRFTRTARRDGPCLTKALELIARRPELKLMQGPPGRAGDTSHFWTVDPKGMIVDPAADLVPRDYGYVGRAVDPSSVREELAEPLSDYMDAVENGDMETTQRMVDEAAKAAGYIIRAYHGTDTSFTVPDTTDRTQGPDHPKNFYGDNIGLFFAAKRSDASFFGDQIVNGFLRIQNPKVFVSQDEWRQFMRENSGRTPDVRNADGYIVEEGRFINEMRKVIEDKGYNGVVIKKPGFTKSSKNSPWYVVFYPNQVKSADPVTYDDQKNVIPLSKRFDSSNPDIRY